MPPRGSHPRIVRVVEGVRGEVAMRMRFTPRFDYGRVRPWVSRVDGAVCAIAGPDALELRGDVSIGGDDLEQTAPLIDLWQSAHDRLYSRLFQS